MEPPVRGLLECSATARSHFCTPQASVQNMSGYLEFVRRVLGEPGWQFANLGHQGVGYREEIERTLEYFKDLYDGWFERVGPTWSATQIQDVPHQNAAVFIRNMFDDHAETVATHVEAKWGHVPHFEVARDHAEAVATDLLLNYDYMTQSDVRPDFSPIPPRESSTH
jgi:hypothetical protein